MDLSKTPWTPEQYKHWVANRSGDPSHWNYEHCVAADQHIKQVALQNFRNELSKRVNNEEVVQTLVQLVRMTYGSAEVDSMLRATYSYPEYMVQTEY